MSGNADNTGGWRIALHGDVDFATAPDLQAKIDGLIEEHASLLIVDLSDVSFLDSSGIRALIHGSRKLEAIGGRLFVQGASGAVARTLEVTGLLQQLSQPQTDQPFDD